MCCYFLSNCMVNAFIAMDSVALMLLSSPNILMDKRQFHNSTARKIILYHIWWKKKCLKLSLFQSDIVSLCRFLSFSGVFECDDACVWTYKPKGERHQTEQKLHKSLCKSTHKFVHLKFSNTQNFPSVGFSLSGNFLPLLLLLFSFLLCAGCFFFLHWRCIFMRES